MPKIFIPLKKVKKKIIGELWLNAVFNDNALQAIKKLVASKKIFPELMQSIATIRNRNLITHGEQNKLQNTTVGFFGLSVGSHAATTWITLSRANAVKIIDFDSIDPSNLNRLRFGWSAVGQMKTEATQKVILDIHPQARVISSTKVDPTTIKHLFSQEPELDIVVDAIDDLEGKILLRKLAKKHKIPLISAADVGDNVMLDIERYDQLPTPIPFHGRINPDEIDFEHISPIKKKQLIIKLIGFEVNSEDMLQSLNDIGKTISTWPQLASTATIAGGIVATTIKKIVLGEKVITGRYYVSLDELLVADFNSPARESLRKDMIKHIKKTLSL